MGKRMLRKLNAVSTLGSYSATLTKLLTYLLRCNNDPDLREQEGLSAYPRLVASLNQLQTSINDGDSGAARPLIADILLEALAERGLTPPEANPYFRSSLLVSSASTEADLALQQDGSSSPSFGEATLSWSVVLMGPAETPLVSFGSSNRPSELES